jgi:hypothetical protein
MWPPRARSPGLGQDGDDFVQPVSAVRQSAATPRWQVTSLISRDINWLPRDGELLTPFASRDAWQALRQRSIVRSYACGLGPGGVGWAFDASGTTCASWWREAMLSLENTLRRW